MKYILPILVFFISANFIQVYPQTKRPVGIATFVSGESHFIQNTQKRRVKFNQVFFEGDTIITKRGQVHIQFLNAAILKILENTQITLQKSLRLGAKKKNTIEVKLKNGGIFSKVVKQKKSKDKTSLKIISPTFVAGVRGTEFLVSYDAKESTDQKKIPDGVFVRDGAVDVYSPDKARNSFKKMQLTKEEQLLIKTNQIKRSILDKHIKLKMEIMSRLRFMSKENYERLIEFKQKNQDLLEKQKKKNSIKP